MSYQKVDFNVKEISPNIGARSITGNVGITTDTDLVEISLFLFVRIVRARDLFGHYGDPYVELGVGRFKGTTMCFRSSNSEPEWNQVFALDKAQIEDEAEAEETLEIFVKNNISRYDEYMGRISFVVSDVPTRFPTDSPLAPQWCGLVDQRGQRCRGELMISCWVGTQVDEAFPEAWHLYLGAASSISIHNIANTRSQIYLMPRIWCLRVNLIQAHDLVLEDRSESSQIFITATLGNLTFTSKPAKNNNGNPTWNEDLLIVVAEPFDQWLILSVEQGTSASHKRLGTCGFPVKDAEKRLDGSLPSATTLNVIQNEGFAAGRLSMRLSLDGGYHIFDEDPQWSSDVNPTSKALWRPRIGVFEIGILNATGLPAMKPRDRTDAYCVAKYGPKWVRSRTVVNSLSPKWNEQYSFDVYDPCTFITICVFDNNQLLHEGTMDTRIGKVRISLSELETNRIYSYSYPLVELQPSGLKKMGEIQLAFRFSSWPGWIMPTLIMCKLYTLPMLPIQHFTNPLSQTQFHLLRKQAALLVASTMSKAEPPLRREVVEYMLDSRETTWSMRRCRADFERINNVFVSGLVAIYTKFDDIRKWKDPISTLIVISVFGIVIYDPQLLLLIMSFCVVMHVLEQHQKRPREPSHFDLQLSHVHTASVDELEEEFDPIPSKFGDTIVSNRYDRLRIAAGKFVALMGDSDTRGERLKSLVSWKDPVVTMSTMILCLIIGFVTLNVPFKAPVFVWLLYLLRHPIQRSPFPPLHENCLRRTPTKFDSVI